MFTGVYFSPTLATEMQPRLGMVDLSQQLLGFTRPFATTAAWRLKR